MTEPEPSQTNVASYAIIIRALRARAAGIDIWEMDDEQIAAALDVLDRERFENPAWLLAPRAWYGEQPMDQAVAHTADEISRRADELDELDDPFADALSDILRNAADHLPEFGGESLTAEPWGCIVCATADGTGACHTWRSALRLLRTWPAETTVGDAAAILKGSVSPADDQVAGS